MKTIETKVYTFDELSDKAKDTARDWAREHVYDYDWWDSIYMDAETIGLKLKSFDLDRSRHATGSLMIDARDCADRIMKEHGNMTETYKTAALFLKDIKRTRDDCTLEEVCEEFLKELLEDYSLMLQHESEYMVSDEHIDDMIQANEYTFTKEGKRFG